MKLIELAVHSCLMETAREQLRKVRNDTLLELLAAFVDPETSALKEDAVLRQDFQLFVLECSGRSRLGCSQSASNVTMKSTRQVPSARGVQL